MVPLILGNPQVLRPARGQGRCKHAANGEPESGGPKVGSRNWKIFWVAVKELKLSYHNGFRVKGLGFRNLN